MLPKHPLSSVYIALLLAVFIAIGRADFAPPAYTDATFAKGIDYRHNWCERGSASAEDALRGSVVSISWPETENYGPPGFHNTGKFQYE